MRGLELGKDNKTACLTETELAIPVFKTEGAEAAWLEKNRAAGEAELRAALRNGKTIPLAVVLAQANKKKTLQPRPHPAAE